MGGSEQGLSRQVTHDGRGSLRIRFPFDRALVDLVKSLPGRRWNPAEKFWSVPEEDTVGLVEALHPLGFQFDEATRKIYESHGGTRDLAPRPAPTLRDTGQLGLFGSEESGPATGPGTSDSGDYTVSKLNHEVRALLAGAFPSTIWLVGEISGFNKSARKRIVGFQLAEREDGGKTLSEINAVVFESTRRDLERKLAAAGEPFRLEDEVTVRVQVRVDLYVPWGLYRVVLEDLDINYTLGEAARRREEILRRLTEQGFVGRNTALALPALPLRVGLITSLGSDAYNDVLRTLQDSGFAFTITTHGARVQGPSTEPSVLNALDWFDQRRDRFDVVLICRGGGSRIDLAWFDSEALGRAVGGFPLPVLVGIGHEQDQSVLDAVGRAHKTPTAAAAALVERVEQARERVESVVDAALEGASRRLEEASAGIVDRASRLARATRNLLERQADRLASQQRRTVQGTRALLESARQGLAHRASTIPRAAMVRVGEQRGWLDRGAQQVLQAAGRDLRLESERTEGRVRRLELVHPRRVIARGYSILRRSDGTVVTEAGQAPPRTELRAELRRGQLALRSVGPVEKPQEGQGR